MIVSGTSRSPPPSFPHPHRSPAPTPGFLNNKITDTTHTQFGKFSRNPGCFDKTSWEDIHVLLEKKKKIHTTVKLENRYMLQDPPPTPTLSLCPLKKNKTGRRLNSTNPSPAPLPPKKRTSFFFSAFLISDSPGDNACTNKHSKKQFSPSLFLMVGNLLSGVASTKQRVFFFVNP